MSLCVCVVLWECERRCCKTNKGVNQGISNGSRYNNLVFLCCFVGTKL